MLADGAAEQALHGQAGLALLHSSVVHVVVLGHVEAADAQQIDHLLVHFLLAVDDASHHLVGIAAHGGQFQVEVHLRLIGASRDVHQAVHANVVVREAAPQLQVAQRHSVHGVVGLQVEQGVVGVAAEDDGSALLELEVFLDDVLYGEFIDAMVYEIGAEHVERALIIKGGTYGARAVEGYIVAAGLVHQEAERGVGRAVDEEVQAYVGGYVGSFLFLIFFGRKGSARIGRSGHVAAGGEVAPFYEVLRAYGIGSRGVVFYERLLLRSYVHVDHHLATLAVNAAIARGVDCAEEGALVVALKVVGQQVACFHVDVIAQVGQMVVVKCAPQDALVALAVGDGVALEHYFVGHQPHRVVLHPVGGVQADNVGRAVGHGFSGEVHVAQWPPEPQVAVGIEVNVAQEAAAEVVEKVQTAVVGAEGQVDVVACRRHISLDVGARCRCVDGHGVDVYLFFALVVVHVGIKHAHAALLKCEAVHS